MTRSRPYRCSACREGFSRDELTRLGEKLVCELCWFTKGCKSCHAELATKADENGEFCTRCYAGWITRNPDELADAIVHGLCRTEEGAQIAKAVLIPEGATAYEVTCLSQQAARRGEVEVAELLCRAAIQMTRRVA